MANCDQNLSLLHKLLKFIFIYGIISLKEKIALSNLILETLNLMLKRENDGYF